MAPITAIRITQYKNPLIFYVYKNRQHNGRPHSRTPAELWVGRILLECGAVRQFYCGAEVAHKPGRKICENPYRQSLRRHIQRVQSCLPQARFYKVKAVTIFGMLKDHAIWGVPQVLILNKSKPIQNSCQISYQTCDMLLPGSRFSHDFLCIPHFKITSFPHFMKSP